MIQTVLLAVIFAALFVGSLTDIKKREVPDWINYSLIVSGIGLRAIFSSVAKDISFLAEGIAGFLVFAVIGYMMFYTGQWGGGDSKMLMGIGAALGLELSGQGLPLLLVFMINAIFIGSAYGLLYSFSAAIIHRKKFSSAFTRMMMDEKMARFRKIKFVFLAAAALGIILLLRARWIDSFVSMLLFGLLIVSYLSFYLFVFAKAVEMSAMIKPVYPEKLTEGDWIAEDVVVDGKKIAGPKDLGIEKKQISELISLKNKGKISRVKVRYGMPFVPSFLIAFILTMTIGAWWAYIF